MTDNLNLSPDPDKTMPICLAILLGARCLMSENDVQEVFSSNDSAAVVEELKSAGFEVFERDDCGWVNCSVQSLSLLSPLKKHEDEFLRRCATGKCNIYFAKASFERDRWTGHWQDVHILWSDWPSDPSDRVIFVSGWEYRK